MRLLILLLPVILLVSCSSGTLEDPNTKKDIARIEVKDSKNITIFDNTASDWMSLKQGEYSGKLAIDESYYSTHSISRGDVIYYKTPAFDFSKIKATPRTYEIARVIALPGERFSIKKGQYFVNDKKLNTFYGQVMYWGRNEKEMLELIVDSKSGFSNTKETKEDLKKFFNQNKDEIQIPNDYYFILGDAQNRSVDSNIFGPIRKDLVKGKVLGYAIE